jgi:hypothetical protein
MVLDWIPTAGYRHAPNVCMIIISRASKERKDAADRDTTPHPYRTSHHSTTQLSAADATHETWVEPLSMIETHLPSPRPTIDNRHETWEGHCMGEHRTGSSALIKEEKGLLRCRLEVGEDGVSRSSVFMCQYACAHPVHSLSEFLFPCSHVRPCPCLAHIHVHVHAHDLCKRFEFPSN